MSNHDWTEIARVMAGLWPNQAAALTDEQVNVWRTVCARYPPAWVIASLRGWAEISHWCPRPSDIRAKLAELRERHAGDAARSVDNAPLTRWEITRRYWASKHPERAEDIEAMPDTEVERRARQWELSRSKETYGDDARGTVAAYWRLQDCLARMGRRAPVDYYGWSPDAEAAYRREYLGGAAGDPRTAAEAARERVSQTVNAADRRLAAARQGASLDAHAVAGGAG